MKRIAVFGTGYVGCVTAACLSRDGYQTIGVDIDSEKVAALNAGESPVVEPGLSELVADQVAAGRLRATEDFREAIKETDIAMIAVGTPSDRTGAVSIVALEKVIESIGQSLNENSHPYTVVVRSTLLPGILENRLTPLLAETSGANLGEHINICNNPEFLREVSAEADFANPWLIVIGAYDKRSEEILKQMYEPFGADIVITEIKVAEMMKYAHNMFNATKISFFNEIHMVCQSLGINSDAVNSLAARSAEGIWNPNYGIKGGRPYGGSCLPKDTRAFRTFARELNLNRMALLDGYYAGRTDR